MLVISIHTTDWSVEVISEVQCIVLSTVLCPFCHYVFYTISTTLIGKWYSTVFCKVHYCVQYSTLCYDVYSTVLCTVLCSVQYYVHHCKLYSTVIHRTVQHLSTFWHSRPNSFVLFELWNRVFHISLCNQILKYQLHQCIRRLILSSIDYCKIIFIFVFTNVTQTKRELFNVYLVDSSSLDQSKLAAMQKAFFNLIS